MATNNMVRGAWVLGAILLVAGCQKDTGTTNPTEAAAGVETLGALRPAAAKYNLDDAVALHGYDPVAYFPEGGGTPMPGKPELAIRYGGVLYQFANETNRDAFKADPAKYEPAYGGWCAWAMIRGGKVDADPEDFIIQNGRLMVFYRNAVVDTRDKWTAGDTTKFETEANTEWTQISGE